MTICSISASGVPHPMPMWFGIEPDGAIVMTTFTKSQKIRNLERDPRVSLLVEAGEEYAELQGVVIYGDAELVPATDQVVEILLTVTKRSGAVGQGNDDAVRAGVRGTASKRTGIRVRPQKIVSWDHKKLGRALLRRRTGRLTVRAGRLREERAEPGDALGRVPREGARGAQHDAAGAVDDDRRRVRAHAVAPRDASSAIVEHREAQLARAREARELLGRPPSTLTARMRSPSPPSAVSSAWSAGSSRRHGGEGLRILAVSVDAGRTEALARFASARELRFAVLHDRDEATSRGPTAWARTRRRSSSTARAASCSAPPAPWRGTRPRAWLVPCAVAQPARTDRGTAGPTPQ